MAWLLFHFYTQDKPRPADNTYQVVSRKRSAALT